MIIVDCCAETSLESRTDFQSCQTETMFCSPKWFLHSNQQLSSKKMPINSILICASFTIYLHTLNFLNNFMVVFWQLFQSIPSYFKCLSIWWIWSFLTMPCQRKLHPWIFFQPAGAAWRSHETDMSSKCWGSSFNSSLFGPGSWLRRRENFECHCLGHSFLLINTNWCHCLQQRSKQDFMDFV